jgi:hypothetical protein
MGRGKHRKHAECLVALDEAHPAHVGGEIEDLRRAVDGLSRSLEQGNVEDAVVGCVENLMPLVQRLAVDRPHLAPLAQQRGDEMSADEAAAAGDEHRFSCT